MAAARGGATEGLAWLGRAPEAKASLLYRGTRLLVRFICLACSGSGSRPRARSSSRQAATCSSPAPIAAGWTRWSSCALPVEPRCWILGSGPSTFTSKWRRSLIRRLGGLCRSGAAGSGSTSTSIGSGRPGRGRRVRADARGAVSGPVGRLGPTRSWAMIALRTDAAILPLAMAGTEELPRTAHGVTDPAGDHIPRARRARTGRDAPRTRHARGAGPGEADDGPPRRAAGAGGRGPAPAPSIRRTTAPAAPAPHVAAPAAGPPRRDG